MDLEPSKRSSIYTLQATKLGPLPESYLGGHHLLQKPHRELIRLQMEPVSTKVPVAQSIISSAVLGTFNNACYRDRCILPFRAGNHYKIVWGSLYIGERSK